MTLFVDAAVFMYAAGGEHPLRSACQRVLRSRIASADGVVTSVEVVQELLHRYLAIRRVEGGLRLARDVIDLFGPLVPVTHAVVRRVPDLADRYPRLSARDLVHVATCLEEGIDAIVTTDLGFDEVRELRRVDPATFPE